MLTSVRSALTLTTGLLLCAALAHLPLVSAQQAERDPHAHEVPPPKVAPRVVTPGAQPGAPPSDAIVLFDGRDLSKWEGLKGSAAQWTVADGAMEVKPGTGGIRTKQPFGSVQLHLEWATPTVVKGESQGRGNSGVFLMSQYEILSLIHI